MKTYSILTLDDDPNINNLLQKIIKPPLFSITTTLTVQEFVFQFSKKEWDFFIIDINLSEGNDAGFKLLRHLRSKLKVTSPIIILSRNDEREKITHALDSGATDYLTKPIDPDMFFTKINYLLDEDTQLNQTLRTTAVPAVYRKSFVTSNLSPYSISEEGLTIAGPNCISKGTTVEIKSELIKEIFARDSIKLMVTKNSKMTDAQYSMFLEFSDEDNELIEKAKSWIINKMAASK